MTTVNAGPSNENRGSFNAPLAINMFQDRWKVQDGNYQVRTAGGGAAALPFTRNYHIFDIPALAAGEVVTSVTLTLAHPASSYHSGDATETLELFDVDPANFTDMRVISKFTPGAPGATPPLENRPISTLQAIFNDLGAGTSYGTMTSSLADNSTSQSVSTADTLTPALMNALTTLGQAGGGDFGIGGSLTSGISTPNVINRIFRGTANFATLSSLQITTTSAATTATPVPIPATAWLFGAGLLAFMGALTLRRREMPG
jgi:hypothetical protein